ncbi:hypothetical protein MRX96_005653 [Rhipicephalus microplus]
MDILVPRQLMYKDLLPSESFDCYDAFSHGPFQRCLLLLCTIAPFLANFHGFLFRLILGDVEYWCKLPVPSPHYMVSLAHWGNFAPFPKKVIAN